MQKVLEVMKYVVIWTLTLVLTYIILFILNKLGVVNEPLNDYWGILIAIIMLIVVIQGYKNSGTIKEIKQLLYKSIENNTKFKVEITELKKDVENNTREIEDHEQRIRNLERYKLKSINN